MWLRRTVVIAIFVLIQLGILIDVLLRLGTDPELDIDWTGTFAPTITWFVLAGIFVVAGLFRAGYEWIVAYNQTNGGRNTTAQQVEDILWHKRAARIYFYDSLIDFVLLTLLIVFLGLTVQRLDRDEDMIVGNERSWKNIVIPLYFFFGLVFVLMIATAVRVYAEDRMQRQLANADCCTATFGGVICCCAVDEGQLGYANGLRQEKTAEYVADAAYHGLPWAFACAPNMTYGSVASLAAFVWFLMPIAFVISIALLASLLDGSTIQLAQAFIPLFVVFGVLFIINVFLLATLICCYRRRAARPLAQRSILEKYAEVAFTITASVLFIVQLALLADTIDSAPLVRNWIIIFIPLIILLVIILLLGCCAFCTCGKPAVPQRATRYDDDNDPVVANGKAQPLRQHKRIDSSWGVFGAN
jgi:hypothetical protein